MFYLTITLYQTYVFLLNKNSISEILTNTIYNTTKRRNVSFFFCLSYKMNALKKISDNVNLKRGKES